MTTSDETVVSGTSVVPTPTFTNNNGNVFVPVGYINGQPAFIQQQQHQQPSASNFSYVQNNEARPISSPPPMYRSLVPEQPVNTVGSVISYQNQHQQPKSGAAANFQQQQQQPQQIVGPIVTVPNELRNLIEKNLQKSYPTKFTVFYGVISIIIAMLNFAYNIVMAYTTIIPVAFGTFAAVYMIVASSITLTTVCSRRFGLVVAAYILQVIGILITFGGYIACNLYVATQFVFTDMDDSATPCYIMMAIGTFEIILSLIYVISVHCSMIGAGCCNAATPAPVGNLPTCYLKTHGILTIFIGVCHIIFQIVLLCIGDDLQDIGSGIWGGLFNVLVGIIVLCLIKSHNRRMYNCAMLLTLISTLISVLGFITMNSIIFSLSSDMYCFDSFCSYKYQVTLPLVIPMFVLGCCVIFMNIVFIAKVRKYAHYFVIIPRTPRTPRNQTRPQIVNPVYSYQVQQNQNGYRPQNYYPAQQQQQMQY